MLLEELAELIVAKRGDQASDEQVCAGILLLDWATTVIGWWSAVGS
jgi:hypothetical protein